MSNKVALIGVYPPPTGGISIHVKRLSDYLDDQGISYTLYDNTEGQKAKPVQYTGSIETWSMKYFFTAKESIIHCHFLRWQVRFFLALLKLRGKRIIFTFHSFRQEESVGLLKKIMIGITGRLGDVFICVTDHIARDLIAAGVPSQKVTVIPGFIAPTEGNPPPLPTIVEQFIAGAGPLLVANGTIGVRYQEEDLYGVDLCLELVRRLAPEHPKLKLVFGITFTTEPNYRAELERRVIEYGIGEHFLFVDGMEFYPLVQRADLMLRPTNTDGDAISIRESLYFGTPVLASDCTARPADVVTFKNRDLDDLVQKAQEMLELGIRIPQNRHNFASDVVKTYGDDIVGR